VSKLLDNENKGKTLLFDFSILQLVVNQSLTHIENRIFSLLIIFLHDNYTHGDGRGIGVKDKVFLETRQSKN